MSEGDSTAVKELLAEGVNASSYRRMADEIGVSPAYLHAIIKGRKTPGPLVMMRILAWQTSTPEQRRAAAMQYASRRSKRRKLSENAQETVSDRRLSLEEKAAAYDLIAGIVRLTSGSVTASDAEVIGRLDKARREFEALQRSPQEDTGS